MFRSYKDTVRTPVKTSKEASKKYYCDLCSDGHEQSVWGSESDVEIHRRRVHKVELIQLMKEPKNYMCTVCLRKQADRTSLIAHIKTDHLLSSADATTIKRELFICDYCNNIFFNKLLLIAHIKSFHSLSTVEKKTMTTLCPFCFKIIKIRSIWFHFLYHGIINTGTCPICLYPFEDYQDALKHAETHPGFYYCTICSYETEKEALFLGHMEKHKKIVNLEGKDVNKVTKFFVPQKRASSWNRKLVNFFRGITLAPEIQICVLCRTLCETEEDMLRHIYGDHSPMNTVEIRRHMCVCGEEFFNRVLLKHHIFMLKGDHRVRDGTEIPKSETESILNENDPNEEIRIVIELNENESNPIINQNIESDTNGQETTGYPSEFLKPKISEENSVIQNKMDNHTSHPNQSLLDDLLHEKTVNSKITEMDENSMIIQTHHLEEDSDIDYSIENHEKINKELDKNSVSDSDIYTDQIILNTNKFNASIIENTKEITVGPKNIKLKILQNGPLSYNRSKHFNRKRPIQQNIVILNDTLTKKFLPSTKLYKDDDCSEIETSAQISYVLDVQQENLSETSSGQEVYEVVEMAGEPNEDGSKMIVEEALLFS